MAHQELGMQLLQRVEADLAEYGAVEQYPKMEGRQLTMVIPPKKKKKILHIHTQPNAFEWGFRLFLNI